MLKPTLSEVIDHIRNRSYMGGIERDKLRVKSTGEVFTPTELVREMLAQIPVEQFTDPIKTFLDPSCGDGQFLSEVLIRKIENGSNFEQALRTIYGVDLMIDNVDLCRERLLCGREDLRHIVEQNIYQADALEKVRYEFKPMSKTRRDREQLHRRRAQKAAEQARIKAEQQERYDRHFKDAPKKKAKNVATF
jgi:type I restriction-modification system DNA methylase subunit